MPLLESGLLTLLKTISFVLDIFTYIPYYIIQEQGKVLSIAKAKKVS